MTEGFVSPFADVDIRFQPPDPQGDPWWNPKWYAIEIPLSPEGFFTIQIVDHQRQQHLLNAPSLKVSPSWVFQMRDGEMVFQGKWLARVFLQNHEIRDSIRSREGLDHLLPEWKIARQAAVLQQQWLNQAAGLEKPAGTYHTWLFWWDSQPVDWAVFPSVYSPDDTEGNSGTYQMVLALKEMQREGVLSLDGIRALDMGVGSGPLSGYLLAKGAKEALGIDVNREAISNAVYNLRLHLPNRAKDFRGYAGDLWDALPESESGPFDLVVFNPPPFSGNPNGPEGEQLFGGPDFSVLKRFVRGLPQRLSPDGKALLRVHRDDTLPESPVLRFGPQALRDLLSSEKIPLEAEFLEERGEFVVAVMTPRPVPRAGLEEGNFSDPANPELATADEVARILRDRYGVPFRQERNGRWVIANGALPELSWTMNAIRPIERGPIFTEFESMPLQKLVYPLGALPSIGIGANSSGVYLGLVEGVDHPVVIKMTEAPPLEEILKAQVLARLGIFPRFFGWVRLADGREGYVMEAVSGQRVFQNHPEDYGQILKRPRDQAELIPDMGSLRQTPSGRFINIDAGHARILDGRAFKGFIDDFNQNPDGPVSEDPVSAAARLVRTRGWFNDHWVILDAVSARRIDLLDPLMRKLESAQELRGRVLLLGELSAGEFPSLPRYATLQALSDYLKTVSEFHRPNEVSFIGPADQASQVSAVVRETLNVRAAHLPPSLVSFLIGLGVPVNFTGQLGTGLEEAELVGGQA